MSGRTRRDDPAPGEGAPDLPPMLVLGEDLPDVEDTTPEELARLKAELERSREQLRQDSERRQREADERLAQERRRAEEELARRQRQLDDAERALVRTERRLRRRATQLGQGGTVERVSVGSTTPSRSSRSGLLSGAREINSRRVPALGTALTLLALAAGSLATGSALAEREAPSSAVQAFTAEDRAHVLTADAVIALDREVLLHQADRELPRTDEGELVSLALARQAAELTEAFPTYVLDDVEATASQVLEDPDAGPVQLATSWEETRQGLGYAVSGGDVERAREALDTSSTWSTVLLVGGVLLLGGVVFVLARRGARLAATVGAVALVPAVLVAVMAPPVDRTLAEASARHDEAQERRDEVVDSTGQDLEVVLGIDGLDPWELEDGRYWSPEWSPLGDSPPEVALVQTRTALGEALASGTPEEVTELALRLVDETEAVHAEALVPALEARDAVVAASARDASGATWVALSLAALIPVAGIGLEALRRRQEGAA